MTYKTFCGGIFDTNCYLVKAPEGWILFDAPEGSCEWVKSLGIDLKLLLLTHGHVDHVQDVARIKREFGCPIGCHPLTAPMISDREFFRNFGFELEIEPAKPDFADRRSAQQGISRSAIPSARSSRALSGQPLFLFAEGSIAYRRRRAFCWKHRPWGFTGRRYRSVSAGDQEKTISARRRSHSPSQGTGRQR